MRETNRNVANKLEPVLNIKRLLFCCCCCRFVVRMSDRAKYERLRRRTLAYERKKFRVLIPWMKKAWPEALTEFDAFFERLEQNNPKTKNLTTTEDFRRFMCIDKGMCDFVFGCGCLLLLFYFLCYVF